MQLSSPAFDHQAAIPSVYTCEGRSMSPPLQWSGAPSGTKSLALIVDDPDAPDPAAPQHTFVHWVVYDLPPDSRGLPEDGTLPAGAQAGRNDRQHAAYDGPCPPVGRHRYFFKLYALDTALPELKKPTKAVLEKAMRGHVLSRAELVGTYQKQQQR
jgi:Raf kinase inhibitor-like YbhB/YbcL family protein